MRLLAADSISPTHLPKVGDDRGCSPPRRTLRPHHAHQLALRLPDLIVKAAQHVLAERE